MNRMSQALCIGVAAVALLLYLPATTVCADHACGEDLIECACLCHPTPTLVCQMEHDSLSSGHAPHLIPANPRWTGTLWAADIFRPPISL